MAIDRIITYIIVILVGVILVGIYFLPEGQFGKAKGAFDKTKDNFLPDITLGQQPLQGSQPLIPQEHRQQLTSMKQAIQRALYSEKRNCFVKYTSFSELKKKGTSIELYSTGDGTDIIINGGAGGAQEVSREHLIGVKPCVIAGDSQTVDNFDHAFLNRKEGVPSSYFTETNFIRIIYDDPWFGYNENRIAFGNSPDQLTTFHDFEGDGWLFTPDINRGNKHICFFPTADGLNSCAARGGLLDDDCFKVGERSNVQGQATVDEATARAEQEATIAEQQRISIPNLVAGGSLDQC